MPKEYEYHEGKKPNRDFEEGMKVLFQLPKHVVKTKEKPTKTARKPANASFHALATNF